MIWSRVILSYIFKYDDTSCSSTQRLLSLYVILTPGCSMNITSPLSNVISVKTLSHFSQLSTTLNAEFYPICEWNRIFQGWIKIPFSTIPIPIFLFKLLKKNVWLSVCFCLFSLKMGKFQQTPPDTPDFPPSAENWNRIKPTSEYLPWLNTTIKTPIILIPIPHSTCPRSQGDRSLVDIEHCVSGWGRGLGVGGVNHLYLPGRLLM